MSDPSTTFFVLFAIVVGLLWVYRIRRGRGESEHELKKCPHCAEYIKREANVCRFCHRKV